MNRNVEIKARVRDPESLRARVEGLADSGPVVIEQTDTFFNCRQGRLKLRVVPGAGGELIHYVRPDSIQPAESRYSLVAVQDPSGLLEALSRALGVRTVVRKTRALYNIGQTRIHLDEVDGLGAFVELEVVLAPGESAGQGTLIAQGLMEKLGVSDEDLVEVAYSDLLNEA
jgi:predicted adenylyl cyclase CyaB